jgi:hypothetical protein
VLENVLDQLTRGNKRTDVRVDGGLGHSSNSSNPSLCRVATLLEASGQILLEDIKVRRADGDKGRKGGDGALANGQTRDSEDFAEDSEGNSLEVRGPSNGVSEAGVNFGENL